MGSSPVLHRRPTPQTPSDGFFLSSLGSGGFQSSFDPDRLRLIRNPAEFPDDLNIVSSLFTDSLETQPSAACTSCVIFIFSFVLRLGVLSGSLSQRIGAQICGFHAECWQPARLRKPPPQKAGNEQPGNDGRIRREFHPQHPQAGASERVEPAGLVGRTPGGGGRRARGAAAADWSLPGLQHHHPDLHPPNFAAL